MKTISMFVDVSNLYYCIGHRFNGAKLDYRKYLDFVSELGTISRAVAYGSQMQAQAHKFIASLRRIGFEPKYREPKRMHNKLKSDWDVGMTIDMIKSADAKECDMMILGSADSDMEPVVKYVRDRGIDVVVFACGVSSELYQSATEVIEVTTSMMEVKP